MLEGNYNMGKKKAIITGVTGQDGSYLAELLLSKNYLVTGIDRRTSTPNTERIHHLFANSNFNCISGDITDQGSILRIIKKIQPDEIYNLAAQSFVGKSWDQPVHTINVTGLGAINVFEAAREGCPSAKILQASSSEMYGNVNISPQNEETTFRPASPYAVAKTMAHEAARIYRESYNMFISCSICFNHESPRRGLEFVTRKITNGVARIKAGLDTELQLGNLDAKRDWSDARDMVVGMWLSLQTNTPKDYVFASGKQHSVREFVDIAFKSVGLNYEKYVTINPAFIRPNDVCKLCGDSSQARSELKWNPTITFEQMVAEMIQTDMQANTVLDVQNS
jgi:GDPmannose 4,6-dehydratase